MIWLLCTGEFYMHGAPKNTGDTKRNEYIESIEKLMSDSMKK
jgi:hypothetical protein